MRTLILCFSILLLFFACESENSTKTKQQKPASAQQLPEPIQIEPQKPIPPETTTQIVEEADKPSIAYPDFPYKLDQPTKSFNLPGKLKEISGLSIAIKEGELMVVNDEKGKVYFLKDGQIVNTVEFHKDGDYEGIERVGALVYVLKSNGNIYELSNVLGKLKKETYKTHLSDKNDVEGLGYDKQTNSLLLACKAKPGNGDVYKGSRAIYRFNLATKTLEETPSIIIPLEQISQFVNKNPSNFEKLLEFFTPDMAASSFAPSAIAVHPQTNEFYILSSVGTLLMILDANGKFKQLHRINKALIVQPEGICFESNGNMWISSEGRVRSGTLFYFQMQE